ncbi:ArnT family glycosyltransferase [Sporomusa malonica]|uniref:Dolichyl-phosphate-mannose-protein mannosyltransferase n=1 Tax=Sporomusa malonica TaxID=112901 RepID=A0A1W2DQ70_9FIRM|nr:glycosyltransferase family 39 protein [Sporomusa malonica]SMC99617.1 Dolichyl-phosphate-mannose-protein mannosyltransferase [Sporomusa malonica]
MYLSTHQWNVMIIIISGMLLRITLAGMIGLGVDESYVVSVARSFSLSYFDHPPLHFWIIWLTTHLTGSESSMVLRLPFIAMFAATTWLMYCFAARMFGERAGVYSALILNISPVFSLSSGSWILPDGPLMLLMMASVMVLHKIFFDPAAKLSWLWWMAAGLLVGLGMLAKYHALFLVIGSLIFILTARERRTLLFTAGPYLAVGVLCVVFLPVVIWNMEHNWISFLFQGGRGSATGIYPLKMLGNIAGQAFWVLPWIWVPLTWVLAKGVLAGPGAGLKSPCQDKQWFLCCMAVGPIFLFTIATLWGAQGLFHWQAPGYLMAIPLLGLAIDGWMQRDMRITRVWLTFSVTTFLLIVMLLGTHTANGWLRQVEPQWFKQGDPSTEALDWRDLPQYLEKQGLPGSQAGFVVTADWIDAGKTDYILGGKLPVLCLNNEPHHFVFMHNLADFQGENALIIGRERIITEALPMYQMYFTTIEPVGKVPIKRAGIPEFDVVVFYAKDFTGSFPLPYK